MQDYNNLAAQTAFFVGKKRRKKVLGSETIGLQKLGCGFSVNAYAHACMRLFTLLFPISN